MSGLFFDEHLTIIDSNIERMRRQTHAGMAHFAGSGPDLKTCRECVFWTGGGETGYRSKTGTYGGEIKPRSCEKFRSLKQGIIGPKIPHEARACRHFEQSNDPPPTYEKRS